MLVVMLVTISIRIISFREVSTTSTITSSSSVLESLASTHVLVSIMMIVTLGMAHVLTTVHTWWTSLILRSILFFNCIDKFCYVIDVFISERILSFILCLPKVNSKWLYLIVEETHCFIEMLNGFLCFFDTIIKYVTYLIFSGFDAKFVNLIIFKSDWNDVQLICSSFTEYTFNFFLWNT